jgi:hypothetical protein
VNRRLGARPWDGRKRPRRALAARPDLTALSAAEVRELKAINSTTRPTWDDPFGVAALTPQQVGRVRALAAKAWGATQGALVIGLEHDAARSSGT